MAALPAPSPPHLNLPISWGTFILIDNGGKAS